MESFQKPKIKHEEEDVVVAGPGRFILGMFRPGNFITWAYVSYDHHRNYGDFQLGIQHLAGYIEV